VGARVDSVWAVPAQPFRLVLDWDGTVTEVDSLHMVLERFGDLGVFRDAEATLGRSLTLREVITLEFETVTVSLDEVVAYVVAEARVRPGFREIVERHRPLVVSGGFHELIEPVLAREGIEVELLANRVEARPDGWRVHWRDETVCATCEEACKRASLPAGELVYVGDGFSDRCAALVADRVFAIGGLARFLDAEGVEYEPFEDFFDVIHALEGGAPPAG
jgi:2-hydroxy-3-keto-5-methylthiopentenyl-1-phosphate phosphatase